MSRSGVHKNPLSTAILRNARKMRSTDEHESNFPHNRSLDTPIEYCALVATKHLRSVNVKPPKKPRSDAHMECGFLDGLFCHLLTVPSDYASSESEMNSVSLCQNAYFGVGYTRH